MSKLERQIRLALVEGLNKLAQAEEIEEICQLNQIQGYLEKACQLAEELAYDKPSASERS